MKTIEIKGWIFAKPPQAYQGSEVQYEFSSFDYERAVQRGSCTEWRSYRKLVEHVIRIEVPDDIDPTALMIKALEAEREDLRAAFQKRLNEINDRISKMQALPFHATEVGEI